jgi:hypothetical protein
MLCNHGQLVSHKDNLGVEENQFHELEGSSVLDLQQLKCDCTLQADHAIHCPFLRKMKKKISEITQKNIRLLR